MKKIISSLVTLASASGVSQERQLFMEVARDEVNTMIDKMEKRGGARQTLCTAQLLHILRASCTLSLAVASACRLIFVLDSCVGMVR